MKLQYLGFLGAEKDIKQMPCQIFSCLQPESSSSFLNCTEKNGNEFGSLSSWVTVMCRKTIHHRGAFILTPHTSLICGSMSLMGQHTQTCPQCGSCWQRGRKHSVTLCGVSLHRVSLIINCTCFQTGNLLAHTAIILLPQHKWSCVHKILYYIQFVPRCWAEMLVPAFILGFIFVFEVLFDRTINLISLLTNGI